jgi:hypothetical protein
MHERLALAVAGWLLTDKTIFVVRFCTMNCCRSKAATDFSAFEAPTNLEVPLQNHAQPKQRSGNHS